MKENQVKVGDWVINKKEHKDLIIDKKYQVIKTTGIFDDMYVTVIDERNDRHDINPNHYEMINSVENDVNTAISLIGKKVKIIDNFTHTVVGFEVISINPAFYNNYSPLSQEKIITLKKGETTVILKFSGGGNAPLESVELVPEFYELKLNASYTAIVTKETIKVGCQTFPITILKQLQELHNKL